MKRPLALTLLALSALTLTSPLHAAGSDGWDWSIGLSAAYLLDYEEPMVSLSVGSGLAWSPFGWNVAVYLEGGRIEDDNESGILYEPSFLSSDIQIVPVTGNIRFEKSLGDHLGVYYGIGLGAAFTEIIVDRTDRDQDVILTGQIFAGVNWYFGDHSEVYLGGRWLYFRDTENYGMENDTAVEIGYRWHF